MLTCPSSQVRGRRQTNDKIDAPAKGHANDRSDSGVHAYQADQRVVSLLPARWPDLGQAFELCEERRMRTNRPSRHPR